MIKKIVLTLFVVNFIFADSTKFVVVTPSYNNEKYCLWNLKSILNQKYDNFELIYINDCSKDKTLELVTEYVNNHPKKDKVKIINNDCNRGALSNIYDAIYSCSDDIVIVTVDGDDAFHDKKVLSYLDEIYQDKGVWMTYGQYVGLNKKSVDGCFEIPDNIRKTNSFRKYKWCSSHLRTFYAGLFKKIKTEDLKYEDEFFDVTWDAGFMYPMLEMSSAGKHYRFIQRPTYIYNIDNPINDNKIKTKRQNFLEYYIRNMKPYKPIDSFLTK